MQQHPPVADVRVPGAPHPLAPRGRDPARAKRQSLLLSILALVTVIAPPLPFIFGAWAIVRASDAGTTGRPALGQVLGIIALILSATALLMVVYALPAFAWSIVTLEEVDPWSWWMEAGERLMNATTHR